jgi:UrcA family protein
MEVHMNKLLLPAALLSAIACGQAVAAPAAPGRTVTVTYRDLDLSAGAGQATLKARLDAAVGKVCPQRFDGGAGQMFAQSTCRGDAEASIGPKAQQAIARATGHRDTMLAGR